jgi:hypothetical protein
MLAVIRVLGERDVEAADPQVSARTAARDRRTAERLEDQPNLANAAHRGALSEEQLAPASDLAAGADDREWATRAPNISPADLHTLAARTRTPTREDTQARRASAAPGVLVDARGGMLDGRFSIPDLDGALVENVLNHMIDRMHPAKGEPWDTERTAAPTHWSSCAAAPRAASRPARH